MEVEQGNVGKQANVHWTKDPYSYDIVFTTHSKYHVKEKPYHFFLAN